jgi:hypothetical protein
MCMGFVIPNATPSKGYHSDPHQFQALGSGMLERPACGIELLSMQRPVCGLRAMSFPRTRVDERRRRHRAVPCGKMPVRRRVSGKGVPEMRHAILLLAVMAAALIVASGVALAANLNGIDRADTLVGTPKGDSIKGFGGGDT